MDLYFMRLKNSAARIARSKRTRVVQMQVNQLI